MRDSTPNETDFQVAPGQRNLYRRGELLVDAGSVAAVKARLGELGLDLRGEEHDADLDLSWLHLANDPDIGDVVDDLKHRGIMASPNHLVGPSISPVTGQPEDMGGPSGRPTPLNRPAFAPRTRLDVGANVTVGVLDTRIASHPWLLPSFTLFVHDDLETARGLDSDGDGMLDGEAGHATFVTGVVLQYAPGSQVLVHHVLNSFGVGDVRTLARGIKSMLRRGVDVLNLSVGCYTRKDRPPLALTRALANISPGTVIVAAAGNHDPADTRSEYAGRPFWPAALATTNNQVVSVGALGPSKARSLAPADFSNSGDWVAAWAPGARIASTYVTFKGGKGNNFTGWARWSGTSFAAPAVAGAIAAAMTGNGKTARDAWSDISSAGKQLTSAQPGTVVIPQLAVETPGRRPPRS